MRSLALGIVLLCAALALTGCVSVQACPSWAAYDSPAQAAKSADAVVTGRVVEKVSTATINGASANVWSVDVSDWRKGSGPQRINVLSTPQACGGDADPYLGDGDPLEAATGHSGSGLFLVENESGWSTLSPVQGITELTPVGQIPPEWPKP
ncbi:hypothetical protein ACFUTX_08920 [Microbacterium sp. NPDC057407]|uniref:hypothetical protein n=1 Tax=Microbacterium sp. NPDC057407 TaxID=3346120 RepID=UPI00366F3082